MDRDRIIFLDSEDQTRAFGKFFASFCSENTVIALHGDLGSGKTTFVQGLALGLEIQDNIQSPTFVFVNHYEGFLSLYHFDLYRMKGTADFLSLGFDEYFDAGAVCVIEWPERISSLLADSCIHLYFSYEKAGRKIVVKNFCKEITF